MVSREISSWQSKRNVYFIIIFFFAPTDPCIVFLSKNSPWPSTIKQIGTEGVGHLPLPDGRTGRAPGKKIHHIKLQEKFRKRLPFSYLPRFSENLSMAQLCKPSLP